MYSKTITYTDFNGTERTETFYFHLSKPELLSLSTDKAKLTDLNNFEFLNTSSCNRMVSNPKTVVDLLKMTKFVTNLSKWKHFRLSLPT